MPSPVRVYVSFAPEDEAARKEIEKHLAKLVKAKRIELRHQGQVQAGRDRKAQLRSWLEQAHIVVQLLTANYEHSRDCTDETERARSLVSRGVWIIPVLVRAYDWQATRFLQSISKLPSNGVPVYSHNSPDEAWANVATGIRRAVEQISGYAPAGSSYAPPSVPPPSSAPPQIYPQVPLYVPYVAPPAPSTPSAFPRVAALLVLCLGASAIVWYEFNKKSEDPSETIPEIPLPTPTTKLVPAETGRGRTEIPVACGFPCCGGIGCNPDAGSRQKLGPDVCKDGMPCGLCLSGRTCVAQSCYDKLPPERSFTLRMAHAVVNGKPPSPSAQICFHPAGAPEQPACVPYSSAWANQNAPGATLPIAVPFKVGDVLTGKGLEVSISESTWWGKARTLASFTVAHDNIRATALCLGLKLAPTTGEDTRVYVFLDEPTP